MAAIRSVLSESLLKGKGVGDRATLRNAIGELLDPAVPTSLKGGFLTALAMHGEDAEILHDFSEVLTAKALTCCCEGVGDIVGTGGDGKNSLNVSTPASFVAAAMGVLLAKHGNRSASSNSGSADVMEHLGGCLNLTPEQAKTVLERCGHCFIFAPAFHPDLRHLAPVRKELGIKTVFNLLGPLLNPCRPAYMVVGVGRKDKAELVATALSKLSVRCLVVHSDDGLDKISPCVPTHTWLVSPGKAPEYRLISPKEFGLQEGDHAYYCGGGGPLENSVTILEILSGKISGPVADFVLVQAAALAWVANLVPSFEEGMDKARAVVREGKALEVLNQYVRWSTQVAKSDSRDILSRILLRRAVDVEYAKKHIQEDSLLRDVENAPKPINLWERLRGSTTSLLAEVKRASPSEGDISDLADVTEVVKRYSEAGVQAISVLTEPVWFKGTLDDLKKAREEIEGMPDRPAILRKDFILTKYQVLEARAHGADTLLLIVAAQEAMQQQGESLGSLLEYSRSLGMEPLVEVVTEDEVTTAIQAGAKVIGVNNRDLKTFKVDLNRTGQLVRYAREKHPDATEV
eukprot:Sspe_Gene.11861::Locus_4027_Transcript_1_1_Confidence_1.000_Length_1764::g.11861::m.11861/K00766/trpD; anthranilate phosphoribosyltransferase